VFERFSEEARQVVVLAQKEARELGHNRIETGHLLLGVAGVGDCASRLIADRFGVSIEALRGLVGDMAPAVALDPTAQVPFVAEAKRALEAAIKSAIEFQHAVIRPLDILWGLLDSPEMLSARVLQRAGVNTDALGDAVNEQLRAIPPVKDVPVAMALRPSPRLYSPPRDPLAGLAPAIAPLELVLGHSASVAVLLPELRVYPEGTLWSVLFLARESETTVQLIRSFTPAPPPGYPDDRLPACELMVRYPDGRGGRLVGNRGAPPTHTELGVWSKSSGGGMSGLFATTYYIAPLPTPGVITISCEWPTYDIPATKTEIDATPIIEAATRARQLWADS
jgi:hypothetical protein